MPDYSLAELARLADVTPRTVRYYVAQGLLASPDAAGPATRYGEGHLARLRLIKRLQREHLPLAEIRARLEGLTEEAIEALVEQPAPADTAPADALGYIHELLGRTGLGPGTAQPPPSSSMARAVFDPAWPDELPVPPPSAAPMGPSPVFPRTPLTPPPALAPPTHAPMPMPPTPPPPPDRSTWERISLDPDVELHVRRPLDRVTNKRVERLIRIARELFEDDPA